MPFDQKVAGFFFNTNNGRGTLRFALEDSARIERGHTYVKAIEWIDDPCSQDPAIGSWAGLGSGDSIPFDGGKLGAGEFEGKTQTVEQAKARGAQKRGHASELHLRDRSVGGTVEELVAAVEAASPRRETGYGSVPRECDRSG